MQRATLLATGLIVFGLSGLAATVAAPVQHAPLVSPTLVVAFGSFDHPTVPRSAVSAPLLAMSGRAALACQTILTMGGVRIGRDCGPARPYLAASAD